MRGVYIFAGVAIVIGAFATYFLILAAIAKFGHSWFKKKEKK